MSRKALRILVGTASVAMLGLALAPTADGATASQARPGQSASARGVGDTNPADFPLSSPQEVADFAARSLADKTGMSPDEAREVLDSQSRFGLAVNELKADYADVLSSARWDDGDQVGVVSLVPNAQHLSEVSGARALALAAGARVDEAGLLTESSRNELAVQLSETIRASHPEIKNMRVYSANDGSRLIVETPVPLGDLVATWAKEPGGGNGVPTTVIVQDGLTGQSTGGVVGGASLNLTNGNAGCTSGFTIRISAVTYLLTAGHCETYLNYGNNAWLTGQISERRGNWGDLQYHGILSGGTGLPRFQYTSGALTTNKYPSSPYSGMWVNRFGRMTSETIQVDKPDSTETIEGVTLTHVAVTYAETNNIRGDSGGPYWIGASGGASAVGIHQGKMWHYIGPIECCHRAVFTPAGNLWSIWPSASYYLG